MKVVEPPLPDGLGLAEALALGLDENEHADIGPAGLVVGQFHGFPQEGILFGCPGAASAFSGAEVEVVADNGWFIEQYGE